MKKIHLLLVFFFVVLLATYSLFKAEQPKIQPSGNVIKIGIIAPLSGPDKNKGELGIRGIEIAQKINPYLANGDRLEWVVVDDQNNPEKSISALKNLAEIDHVSAIFMFSNSNAALETAKRANQYKIPILAIIATHPDITKYSTYISQFSFDDNFQASVAALFIRDEMLLDKAAIITQSSDIHASYLAQHFAKKFAENEGSITATYDLNSGKVDYELILQQIKITHPDILYIPVNMEHLFNIRIALGNLDWDPPILVSDGILPSAIAQQQYPLDLLDEIFATDIFSFDMEFTQFGKQMIKRIEAMSIVKNDIRSFTALGLEAYALLMHIIDLCPDQDKAECINKHWHSSDKFLGIKGYISFNPQGKANRSLNINQFNDGVTQFIARVY